MSNIQFFAISKYSTNKQIYQITNIQSNKALIESESEKVMAQILQLNLHAEERQKVKTSNGAWYFKYDEKDVAYLALTQLTYPERYAYMMF